jgi:hypothetical protein
MKETRQNYLLAACALKWWRVASVDVAFGALPPLPQQVSTE